MTASAQQDLHLDFEGRHITLRPGQSAVIGRGTECEVVMTNTQVSRRHVEITSHDGIWVIHDLESSNGTFQNGQRIIGTCALEPGSRIELGGPGGVSIRVGFSTSSGFSTTGSTSVPTGVADPTAQIRLPGKAPRAPAGARAGQLSNAFASASVALHGEAAPTGRTTVFGSAPQLMPSTGEDLTIGRGLDNKIVIEDLLASRHHARLRQQGEGVFSVDDLGSRNGTYINGTRVASGILREGDMMTIGHVRFTVTQGKLVASQDDGDVDFVANHLSFTLPDGKKLLDDVTFGLEGSSLVAVIGPSGAGKSTLLKALIGAQKATEGEVYYDGRDLYANYDDLRHRIGVVPQDDVVHTQLTVRQALRYAAELRFPDDLDREAREGRVEEVIQEIGLSDHAETTVARLSGGQRKRTSVALELLTQPSLLFLDEPTSGLDPGLDKRVMSMLRDLAKDPKRKRTVVVITHNVASLGICDRVLLLAPGGKVAYFGPPRDMLSFFNAEDHADIFTKVTGDPQRAQHEFARSSLMSDHVSGPLSAPRSSAPSAIDPDEAARQQSLPRQLSTLVRRQIKVIASDRGFGLFMLALPIVLAVLCLLVPGGHGLRTVSYTSLAHMVNGQPTVTPPPAKPEATQILTLLIMGSVFMGLASTIRELVAERPIYMREKAVGLSAFAYIGSKVVTFGTLVAVQCAIMVGVVLIGKDAPNHSVILGLPILELYLACLLTGLVSVALGLALSTFAKTSEQVMPMLVVTVMCALVFSTGLFPLGSAVRLFASISPSRWGLAMAAQTADVQVTMWRPHGESMARSDTFWDGSATHWLLCAAFLGILFAIAFVVAWIRARRLRSV